MISKDEKKFSQRKECEYIKNNMIDFEHENKVPENWHEKGY